MYLIEKEIESRALILIGAFLLLLSAVTIRVIAEKNGKDKPIASVEMPMLDAAAEQSLLRGEPLRISIDRLSSTFARPTIFFGSSSIWIYPSVLSPIERLVKRILDVLLASILILVLAPVIAATALAVLVRGIPFEAGTQDVREHFKVQDHTPARSQAHTRTPRTQRS